MKSITKYDVYYRMITLREEYLQEGNQNLEKFTIKVSQLADYFKSTYNNLFEHIKTLENDGLVVDKDKGYIPIINEMFVRNLVFVYDECKKRDITPSMLLNKKAVEIIKRGLGKRNIKLKDLYSDIHSVTLKRYFNYFLEKNLVMLGINDKPQTFDFNDETVLRRVLLTFGETPDIDINKKYSEEENYEERINKLKDELSQFVKNKAIHGKMVEEILYDRKIHFITHTTNLEGNTMTYKDVKTLLEDGGKIINHNMYEMLENKNIEIALNFIDVKLDDENFTKNDLKAVHRMVLYNVDKPEYKSVGGWDKVAGRIRDYKVKIGNNRDFKVSDVESLDEELDEFFSKFNNEVKRLRILPNNKSENLKMKLSFLAWMHSEFQHIHPFGDGNSRATRLLFSYCVQTFGFPLIDIYNSYEYQKVTKLAKKRDDDELYKYFIRLILDNIRKINLNFK